MAPSAEDKAAAVDLKNKGNDAFKKHDWPAAIENYTKAIELDGTEPTYYSNRAQVQQLPHLRPFSVPARVADSITLCHRPTSRQKPTAMPCKTRQRPLS